MAETIQELTTDIRNSVAGRGAGKTVQELVKEIRDAVARSNLLKHFCNRYPKKCCKMTTYR